MSVTVLLTVVLLVQAPADRRVREPELGPTERSPDTEAPAAESPEAAREVQPRPSTVPAFVDVRNEMGKFFKFVESRVVLDGVEVARRRAPEGQELDRSFRAFSGSLAPGKHVLVAEEVFVGRNTGIFSYLDGYKYRVQSETTFTIREGESSATLNVVARERRGVDVPLEKRPQLVVEPAAGSATIP